MMKKPLMLMGLADGEETAYYIAKYAPNWPTLTTGALSEIIRNVTERARSTDEEYEEMRERFMQALKERSS